VVVVCSEFENGKGGIEIGGEQPRKAACPSRTTLTVKSRPYEALEIDWLVVALVHLKKEVSSSRKSFQAGSSERRM